MRRILLFTILFLLANIAWMGFVREPLPPTPEIVEALSPKMPLRFAINKMDYSGVELMLDKRATGQPMFAKFQMSNAWKTGRSGLVLQGIGGASAMKQAMSPQKYVADPKRKAKKSKDFTAFMKDRGGRGITSYTLNHTLVKGKDGRQYMQMTYSGPPMEMIQMLQIPRPITVPGHLARKFVPKGTLQFQRGTVAFDKRINGFNVPVIVKGPAINKNFNRKFDPKKKGE